MFEPHTPHRLVDSRDVVSVPAQASADVPSSDPGHAAHLGLVVYFWGRAEQIRLVVDHLAPAVRSLRRDELVQRFWFGRFDARGPHVFALFSSPARHLATLEARLSAGLDDYLVAAPSTVEIAPDELATLHAQCRGKVLCTADELPGMARNNSYRFFAHGDGDYPLQLGAGLEAQTQLWQQVDAATSWAVDRLGQGPTTVSAVHWIAAVDRALRACGVQPAAFWRYHAETLITTLSDRLKDDEAAVLAALPAAVGERNAAAFSRIWQDSSGDDRARPPAHDLVELVLAEPGLDEPRRHALIREINHTTLAQLFQPVQAHVPLILYAWQRDL